jgi:hypothetical protein
VVSTNTEEGANLSHIDSDQSLTKLVFSDPIMTYIMLKSFQIVDKFSKQFPLDGMVRATNSKHSCDSFRKFVQMRSGQTYTLRQIRDRIRCLGRETFTV